MPAEVSDWWVKLQAARVLQREWRICRLRWLTAVQDDGEAVAVAHYYFKQVLLRQRIAFLDRLNTNPYTLVPPGRAPLRCAYPAEITPELA